MADSGVYEAREELLIDASPAVAAAGQVMYERLRTLRRAVASGADLTAPEFHDAYHPYLEAVWQYREHVREELGTPSLRPETFGWDDWNGRARCPDRPQALQSISAGTASSGVALGGDIAGGIVGGGRVRAVGARRGLAPADDAKVAPLSLAEPSRAEPTTPNKGFRADDGAFRRG